MLDENAFRDVVERTHATVFRVASALVADRDEADDVTQEAYVRAWSHRDELRDGAAALPWLCRIVRNVAHDRRRGWWSRITAPLDERALAQPAEASRNADVALESAEDAATVRRALRTLPEKQRTVLALREVEGLSYDDIAAALDIPVGTVESRLHRARAALAHKLRAWRDREDRA